MTILPARSVTMQHVAELAQVAAKTVSRVINNEPGVNNETKRRVLAAIEQLDYRPNLNARGLAGDRSYLVALFYDKPGDYLSQFQTGAVERCRESGFHLMVEPWDLDDEGFARRIGIQVRQLRVDGVILLPPLCDHPLVLHQLRSSGVPIVRIAPRAESTSSPFVRTDDYSASRALTAHLLALGHRRIGFILGRPEHGATEQRHRGFRDEMAAQGVAIDETLVLPGNFLFEDGLVCARRMLGADRRPTAIFASNDDTAAAALSVAHERGLRLPAELSVVGFDDAPVAGMVWPQLTTIRQQVSSMGRAAAELIVTHLPRRQGWPDPLPSRFLGYELVVRGSTAAPGGRTDG